MKKVLSVLVGLLIGALTGFSATNDLTVGDGYGYPDFAAGNVYVLEGSIDFSKDDGTTNDVYQVITIPANTWVLGCIAEVTTGEGAALLIDVGDASDADGWMADINGSNTCIDITSRTIAVDTNFAVTVTDAYGLGKFYTSNETITATIDNIADDAKMTIRAVVVDGN